MVEWLKKKKTHIYGAYKRFTSDLKTNKLKVRGWEKVFHANGNKKVEIAIPTSDKTDFKTKTVMRQRRTLDNDKGI